MITDLTEVGREEVRRFGGKATNLGFLIKKGFNVPEGFCISSDVKKIDKNLRKEIVEKYKNLQSDVSVRSSATVEDSKNASFAGQFDSFLNIDSKHTLFEAIENCWKSVKSQRVQAYTQHKKSEKIGMAVIVQKMVHSDYAGVMFSESPIKKEDTLIEMTPGLGDKLVSGEVTPNTYFIKRSSLKINQAVTTFQVNHALIVRLVHLALEIEKTYGFPQDIEFCVKDKKIFVLQSRPITAR